METEKSMLPYLFEAGIQGATESVKKYLKENEINSDNSFKETVEKTLKGFANSLPFPERAIAKTILSMPWSGTMDLIYNGIESSYESALKLGKNDDGSFKNTMDTIVSLLVKYLWSK